jgi:WD40 repeat protein
MATCAADCRIPVDRCDCVLVGSILGQSYVISGGEDGTLRFWHAETGEPNYEMTFTNPDHAPVLGVSLFRTAAGEHVAHLCG